MSLGAPVTSVKSSLEILVKNFIDKRGLARTGDTGNRHQSAKRNVNIEMLNIENFTCPDSNFAFLSASALLWCLVLFLPAQISKSERFAFIRFLKQRFGEISSQSSFPAMNTCPRPDIDQK